MKIEELSNEELLRIYSTAEDLPQQKPVKAELIRLLSEGERAKEDNIKLIERIKYLEGDTLPDSLCHKALSEWLFNHGYDGLYNPDQGCACGCLVDDLMPCGEGYQSCNPGYKKIDESGENDWIIQQYKEGK